MFDDGDACNLMDTVGSLTSVADIWLGHTFVETDYGAGVESCGGGKRSLAWYRSLSEIFGRGPCQFVIFGSGLTSVEDVNTSDQSPRRGHALWLRREPVRRRREVDIAR